MKMKYQKTRTEFNLKAQHQKNGRIKFLPMTSRARAEVITVRPFNGEAVKDNPSVSWSHGLTHFKDVNSGKVYFCGVQAFEKLAQPVRKFRLG